jgi:4-amino-4-deoxy-L-arabinose transferase-like glycosyltransferase
VLAAAIVVALATGLRLAWVLLVPTHPVGDFAMYLESAAHLASHGALDPEFVYMPGYVILLAGVKLLGGGLLAAKLVTVALAGGAAGAIFGLTERLWDRRAALIAGLLYAAWPAGIAVCSVTGTDMPTAALVVIAAWALVRFARPRWWLGALLFGAAMGAAAWIRAVAMPLAALGLFPFRACLPSWRAALRSTALAGAVAVLVLLPWALRNRARYGELFFTDSHGGLTALVGANPDSEGRYSRSLNRMFELVTGYRLLAEPHRAADRAAYALARRWTWFEPAYAAGLVAVKAERLLANERPLLYWPLFRAGVLRPPRAVWFAQHRRALESLVDDFWAALVVAALFGSGLAAAQRRWAALSFVPIQLALLAIYALFFAEVRYQLPIVVLLFPAAGGALGWLAGLRTAQPGKTVREAVTGGAVVLVVLGLWGVSLSLGARLRERHRWAVHVCQVAGETRFCGWRRAGGSAPRGVWNGVGVEAGSAASSDIELPAGRWRLQATLDLAPGSGVHGRATLDLAPGSGVQARAPLAVIDSEVSERPLPVAVTFQHPGGPLGVSLRLAGDGAARLWLSDLKVSPP